MCVGYYRVQRDREYKERQLHWLSYLAVADVKKSRMTIQKFWPIDGEKLTVIKPITAKQVQRAREAMLNLRKNG